VNKEVAVIITNKVQKEIALMLKDKGVNCTGVEADDGKCIYDILKNSKKIVLPFPSTKANFSFLPDVENFATFLTPEHTVIGGMIKGDVREALVDARVKFYDYFENEAYVLKNAQLTSQGAIRLLFENTNDFLIGKRVLVTGFGRIGKSLALMLKSLGMKVFVAVRREESAVEALAMGFDVFNFKAVKGTLFYFDYIFNTVPFTVFSGKDVAHLKDCALYFELASSPFGADKNDFTSQGKNYIHGGALPGRYYPAAVARNIVDYILSTEGDSDE